MKKLVYAGAVDQTIDIFIQDSSSSTGAGLTGLVYNTASLVCYYRKGATGSATALTLATQTVGGAHSDGGFVEISAANMPGMYRLDLSDTIVATAGTVTMMLKGATNMAPLTIELQVIAANLEDGVRLGLTGLANAVPGAAGGLVIAGTNAPITFTGSGSAMSLISTGSNGKGLVITGHGSGEGLDINSGATGIGATITATANTALDIVGDTGGGVLSIVNNNVNGYGYIVSGDIAGLLAGNTDGLQIYATDGVGLTIDAGTGTHGLVINCGGQANEYGLSINGPVRVISSAGNHSALELLGNGSGAGVKINGGVTGPGADINGGATSGIGIDIDTTSGAGITINAGGGNAPGLLIAGHGTAAGVDIDAGATGPGVTIDAAGNSGLNITAAGTAGINVINSNPGGYALSLEGSLGLRIVGVDNGVLIDAGTGVGIDIDATGGTRALFLQGGSDPALYVQGGGYIAGASGQVGLDIYGGLGAAAALKLNGGSTGPGLQVVGGFTSGPAAQYTNTTGDVIVVTAAGGNGDAVQLTPHGTGYGLNATLSGGGSGPSAGDIADEVWSPTRDATLKSLFVNNNAGDAVRFVSSGGGIGLVITGDGFSQGLDINSGSNGAGVTINGGSDNPAVQIDADAVSGTGIAISAGLPAISLISIDDDVVTITALGTNHDAIYLNHNGTGWGINGTLSALGTANFSIDGIFDEVVDGTYTFRQSIRLQNSALAGKVSGADANAPVFRDLDDTKNRITATTDADGNRLALTYNLT